MNTTIIVISHCIGTVPEMYTVPHTFKLMVQSNTHTHTQWTYLSHISLYSVLALPHLTLKVVVE